MLLIHCLAYHGMSNDDRPNVCKHVFGKMIGFTLHFACQLSIPTRTSAALFAWRLGHRATRVIGKKWIDKCGWRFCTCGYLCSFVICERQCFKTMHAHPFMWIESSLLRSRCLHKSISLHVSTSVQCWLSQEIEWALQVAGDSPPWSPN